MIKSNSVWIFNGSNSPFPCGVFENQEQAETFISAFKLSGVLTLYPVGLLVYDWAIANGDFIPKNEKQKSAEFIQNFSAASQEHFHYENGILD